jgi:membrane protease YdiL (CAAX protease family)
MTSIIDEASRWADAPMPFHPSMGESMAVTNDRDRTTGGGVRRWVSRFPLVAYVVIAYAFSWLIEVPIALSAQGVLPFTLAPTTVALGLVVATFGPSIAAFVVLGMSEGRPGVVALLRRIVLWRVAVRWYLFVLFGIPLVVLVGTVVVPGAVQSFQPIVGTLLVAYPWAFVLTFLLGGPLGEEPGWRGFALPRLQERWGPLLGSLALGVVWALWHTPLFWSGVWTPPTIANIIMFIVMIVALTVIMTWVFNHARGSVLITILMHASFNTFANRVAAPLFPAPMFDDFGLLPVLLGFGITAIVLIVVTRGRLGQADAVTPQRTVDPPTQ